MQSIHNYTSVFFLESVDLADTGLFILAIGVVIMCNNIGRVHSSMIRKHAGHGSDVLQLSCSHACYILLLLLWHHGSFNLALAIHSCLPSFASSKLLNLPLHCPAISAFVIPHYISLLFNFQSGHLPF